MNIKSIIKCGLLLLGVGAASVSCEDMFKAENTLVTTKLAPQDTLFHVMGIVKKMQKLADRTVLLGEVRADLVEVDPLHAPTDIQELGDNNISLSNAYNKPADYYAVINSCNIYLNTVDSLRKSQGTRGFYEKEILAVKSYRAWCYLELVKIYGEVPFLTKPVLTSDDAEAIVASGQKAGAEEILSFIIDDLMGYPFSLHPNENNAWRSSYGNITFAGIRFDNMVIPIRALLAELYLWRATFRGGDKDDYVNAIRMYHDYFTFPDEEINTGSNTAMWATHEEQTPGGASIYWDNFNRISECAGVLPVDTAVADGNVTELRSVFNSLLNNNYYPAVTASDRLKSISKAQDYCQLLNEADRVVFYYREHGENNYSEYKSMEGDLRLYSVTDGRSNVWSNSDENRLNSSYNSVRYYNRKYGGNSATDRALRHLSFIPFYRNNILYLHMAEALNRAGYSETAFAVLKYGLSYYTMTNRNRISKREFDELCKIKSYGFTNKDVKYSSPELSDQTLGSFVVWSSEVFGTYMSLREGATYPAQIIEDPNARRIQRGIHSFGSGNADYNDKYYLDSEDIRANAPSYDTIQYIEMRDLELPPICNSQNKRKYRNNYEAFKEDSIIAAQQWEEDNAYNQWAKEENERKPEVVAQQIEEYYNTPEILGNRKVRVAKLILDEEALEGAFEGQRFYDLMRFQMQEGVAVTPGSTITMPAFMTEEPEKYGTDKMTGKPWFLTLPKR